MRSILRYLSKLKHRKNQKFAKRRLFEFIEHKFGFMPHQWLIGSTLKTGRREMQGSIFGRAYRPSRLEFNVVFSETRVTTG